MTASTPIITLQFGGLKPGTEFDLQTPSSLGLRGGGQVDALVLNGNTYGGGGGAPSTIYQLNPDDYWTDLAVRSGDGIDHLTFQSKSGIVVDGGGGGGNMNAPISGALILRLGGKYGALLNNLYVELVPQYFASTVVVDRANAILDIHAGYYKAETYTEEISKLTESYSYVTQMVTELTMNTSASGEYYVNFSASTGLKTTYTTTEDIKNTSEKTLENTTTVDDEIQDGEVGLLICTIRIMKDSDGNYWYYPTGPASWVKLLPQQFPGCIGCYVLTGGVDIQLSLVAQPTYANLYYLTAPGGKPSKRPPTFNLYVPGQYDDKDRLIEADSAKARGKGNRPKRTKRPV